MADKEIIGITVKKSEDPGEWYSQVLQKAELIEYSLVSGCYVLRPHLFAMWEKATAWFDTEIKKRGVKNASFPMLIPEQLLTKEKEHVAGFAPEVAWVTQGGDTKLPERLAIRPTSETIMYESFSKWIRSHRDLPLKLNQWCNIVRWEFKHPTPLLRSREFLWQEGHTAHATDEEADAQVLEMLNLYERLFEDLYAIPVLKGNKAPGEKFAGAKYTSSVETFLPIGKAIQAATSHHLGTGFGKAFDIHFLDATGKKQVVHQTSWGFSTRSLGILILFHGDDKGLILPPKLAPVQVVIIPIYRGELDQKKVMREVDALRKSLEGDFATVVDDREGYSPGWKYNHWELKGACIRIEIGPKDLEKEQAILCRRDLGLKEAAPLKKVKELVGHNLRAMQRDLLERGRKFIANSTLVASNWQEFEAGIAGKKLVKAAWCGANECSAAIKEKTDGAKSLNIPFEQPAALGKCVQCDTAATCIGWFAKSY